MKKYIIATIALVGVVAAAGAVSTNAAVGNSSNGNKTINTVLFSTSNTTKHNQSNSAFQSNAVISNINSGGNQAGKNTGAVGVMSDPSIKTGQAISGVGITNSANQNAAAVVNCGCEGGVEGASNVGNGSKSVNTVIVSDKTKTVVNQVNQSVQVNKVINNVNSGGNKANSNTGGDVNIKTGSASSTTVIENTANSNEAVIGGSLLF